VTLLVAGALAVAPVACSQPSAEAIPTPSPRPTLAHIDNSGTPQPTRTPAPLLVSGAQLGGPITAFIARYGGANPPGATYQWDTTVSGLPVQITVSLALGSDSLDGQYRALFIDLTNPNGAGAPWSAATQAAIASSFLPSDGRHTRDVAGSDGFGPDHIATSPQLAASLNHTVFQDANGLPVTPGTFDWQCSTQQPACEVGVGTNS